MERAMADIYAPEFTNEEAAIAHLEKSRWPDQVTCPHCGSVSVTKMAGKTKTGYFQWNDDEQHLSRYVTEFEFRFSNRIGFGVDDTMRAEILLNGIEGKRRPNWASRRWSVFWHGAE